MKTSDNIAILILAAGTSTRMGTPKQLLPWKHTNLLGNAINSAVEVSPEHVFVVLGANAEKIKAALDTANLVCIDNPDYKSGQGSSLACGIDRIMQNDHPYRAALILLCDQPLLDSVYLDSMIAAFDDGNKGIVATSYGDRAGVPAIFDQKYFSKLATLDNDNGAKAIIKKHVNDLLVLDAGEKVMDVDTVTEYKHLIKKLGL